MNFIPGRPKPAGTTTAEALKAIVTDDNKIIGAKRVGGGVIKVFMSGDTNYYANATTSLYDLLRGYSIDI